MDQANAASSGRGAVVVRGIRPEDERSVAALFEKVMTSTHLQGPNSLPAVRKFIAAQTRSGEVSRPCSSFADFHLAGPGKRERRAMFWVAEGGDGQVVGFVGVQQRQDVDNFVVGELKHLVVVPEWRGRGVGQTLVRTLLTFWSSTVGGDAVVLETLGALPTMQPAIRLYRRVGFTMLQSRVVGSRESGFRLDSYVWFSCVNESSAGKGKRLPAMGTINPSLLSVRNPAPEGSVEAAAAPVYFCNSCCRGNGLNEAGVEVAAEAKGLDGKQNEVCQQKFRKVCASLLRRPSKKDKQQKPSKGSGPCGASYAERKPHSSLLGNSNVVGVSARLSSISTGSLLAIGHPALPSPLHLLVDVEPTKSKNSIMVKLAPVVQPYNRLCLTQKRTVAWGGKSSRGKFSSFELKAVATDTDGAPFFFELRSVAVKKPPAFVAASDGKLVCHSCDSTGSGGTNPTTTQFELLHVYTTACVAEALSAGVAQLLAGPQEGRSASEAQVGQAAKAGATRACSSKTKGKPSEQHAPSSTITARTECSHRTAQRQLIENSHDSAWPLTESQILHFKREGYLVVPGVLDEAAVQKARNDFNSALAGRGCDVTLLAETSMQGDEARAALARLSSTGGAGGVLDVFYDHWKLNLTLGGDGNGCAQKYASIADQLFRATYLGHELAPQSGGLTERGDEAISGVLDPDDPRLWEHPFGQSLVQARRESQEGLEKKAPLSVFAHVDRVGFRVPDEVSELYARRASIKSPNRGVETDGANGVHRPGRPQGETQIAPPASKRKAKRKLKLQRSLTPHLDCCPVDLYYGGGKQFPRWRPIQCMLSLSDTQSENHGGFECVPAFHREFATYFREKAQASGARATSGRVSKGSPDQKLAGAKATVGKLRSGTVSCVGDYCAIQPGIDAAILRRFRHVPIPAGAAVFWDQRLPHANARHNYSTLPRCVVYGGFLPRVAYNTRYVQEQARRFLRRAPQVDFWIETESEADGADSSRAAPEASLEALAQDEFIKQCGALEAKHALTMLGYSSAGTPSASSCKSE